MTLKINYLIQARVRPPHFIFFVNSKCPKSALTVPCHYLVGSAEIISQSQSEDVAGFGANEHFFIVVAWKRNNHVGNAICFWQFYYFFFFEFSIPNDDFPSFIAWNEGRNVLSFGDGWHWSSVSRNSLNAFTTFPKIDWSVCHSRKHELLLVSFVRSVELEQAKSWRVAKVLELSPIGIQTATFKSDKKQLSQSCCNHDLLVYTKFQVQNTVFSSRSRC